MQPDILKRVVLISICIICIFWIVLIFRAVDYIGSDEFRQDVTKAGIVIKHIANDIKEAE